MNWLKNLYKKLTRWDARMEWEEKHPLPGVEYDPRQPDDVVWSDTGDYGEIPTTPRTYLGNPAHGEEIMKDYTPPTKPNRGRVQ